MRLHALLAGFLVGVSISPVQGQGKDAWEPFAFLIGRWAGSDAGASGEVSFSFDLAGSVLIRRNRTVLQSGSGAVHEDLLIVFREPDGRFRADFFDNEGHVIHYSSVTADSVRRIVFQSEAAGGMPAFRLIHSLDADSVLDSDFQIAPPGGDFKTYIRGRVKRIE